MDDSKEKEAGVDINGFEPVTLENLKENNNRWYERG